MNSKPSIKQQLLDELICSICLSTLNNPLMTSCRHVYCDKCIKTWLAQDRRCPICKLNIPNKQLKLAPKELKDIIFKIEDLLSDDLEYEKAIESPSENPLKKIVCIDAECIDLIDEEPPIKVPKRHNGKPQVVYLC